MDDLEVRIPKEISEYHEKFYGLTIRQIIAALMMAAINVPLYLWLTPIIGSDISSYVVIIVAAPIGFIGFVKIHNLDAEKIIPYWWRNYISFAKPLLYKTEKQIAAEKEAKKRKNKKKAKQEEQIKQQTIGNSKKEEKKQLKVARQQAKEQKKQEKLEVKRLLKEEKEHRKQLKAKRKAKAELEEARRKFGLIDEPTYHSSGLNDEELQVLREFAQALGRKEGETNVIQKKENETTENADTRES